MDFCYRHAFGDNPACPVFGREIVSGAQLRGPGTVHRRGVTDNRQARRGDRKGDGSHKDAGGFAGTGGFGGFHGIGVGVLLGGSEGVGGGGGFFHGVAGENWFADADKKEIDCKRNITKTFLPGFSAPQNRQAIPSCPSSSLGTHLSAWSVLRAPGRWRPAGSSASKTSAGPSWSLVPRRSERPDGCGRCCAHPPGESEEFRKAFLSCRFVLFVDIPLPLLGLFVPLPAHRLRPRKATPPGFPARGRGCRCAF